MTIFQWIDLASGLGVDGLEFYPGFLESRQPGYLLRVKRALEEKHLVMPMLCVSPDFTVPDSERRKEEVVKQKDMIDLAAFLGGRFCRVLSGQAYPEVPRAQGVRWVVECIRECVDYAARRNILLNMENHYKDNYWRFPEFAQKREVFLEIVSQVDSPWFGVNFDPSNAWIAGEDPMDLLEAVKHRVVTMHASDRYLEGGTWEDLKSQEGSVGYAKILKHGVIGKGLNDYDRIFQTLCQSGFDGWISIEDGLNGMEELQQSAAFLRRKIQEHFRDRR